MAIIIIPSFISLLCRNLLQNWTDREESTGKLFSLSLQSLSSPVAAAHSVWKDPPLVPQLLPSGIFSIHSVSSRKRRGGGGGESGGDDPRSDRLSYFFLGPFSLFLFFLAIISSSCSTLSLVFNRHTHKFFSLHSSSSSSSVQCSPPFCHWQTHLCIEYPPSVVK